MTTSKSLRSGGRGLLITGLALIAVGLLGASITGVILTAWSGSSGPSAGGRGGATGSGGYASNGERIFFTGVGHQGPIEIEWQGYGGMMRGRRGRGPASTGCAGCHGADGRGGYLGMMRGVRSADIRYRSLTRAHENDEGGVSSGWTDQDIARAIREGVEPEGERLDPLMPRWRMDETDMADTIEYLKELDRR